MPQFITDRMLRDLGKVDEFVARLDATLNPPADSIAAMERSDRLRAYGYDLAAMLLGSAIDHLRAWRMLIYGRLIPIYAHFSLLRTAHETAHAALWLVEPGISSDERLARGVAGQFADYEERRKAEADTGIVQAPPAKSAAQRQADLIGNAKSIGLTRPDKNGKDALPTRVPTTVELFERFEPVRPGVKGSFVYRVLSGFAHGKQWAGMFGALQATPLNASNRALAITSSNDMMAMASTVRAVNAVDRALQAYEALHRSKT